MTMLAETQRVRLYEAVDWAKRWKTYPIGAGDVVHFQAFKAAAEHFKEHPDASKYDLAKVACNAARRAASKR
jgi:hypothetical protein